jgi:hypothetical protein
MPIQRSNRPDRRPVVWHPVIFAAFPIESRSPIVYPVDAGKDSPRPEARSAHADRRTFDPPRTLQVLHSDGRWFRVEQFEWGRWPTGQCWAGLRYTIRPGATYIRSVPSERFTVPSTARTSTTALVPFSSSDPDRFVVRPDRTVHPGENL